MYTDMNVFGAFASFLQDLATSVSKTFTGADTGAVLVMIIFYLVALIVVVLLLKVLVKTIKSFFFALKHKKEKVPNTNKSDSMSGIEKYNTVFQTKDIFENFDGKEYLELLSLKYNKVNDLNEIASEIQPITANPIQLLVIDGAESNKELSVAEKEEIAGKIENKKLSELNTLLTKTTKEAAETGRRLATLSESLAIQHKNRENLAEEELSVLDRYNAGVDELSSLKGNFENEKAVLSVEYSKLFNFISEIITQKDAVLGIIREINNNISSVPVKIEEFNKNCDSSLSSFAAQFSQRQELLKTLKNSYTSISDSRTKKDEEILGLQHSLSELVKKKAVCDETVDALQVKIAELSKLEAERKAREEAERLAREKEEAERRSREVAEKKAREEAERAARLEAEKRERERIAKEQAEKAAKLEAERKAREEADRLAKEKAEAERLAREVAEKKAREEAERLSREEAQRAAESIDNEEPSVKDPVVEGVEGGESDVVVDTADVIAVKEKIQKQAQNSYALNFDDIPPEMVEKIAQASQKRKTDILKAVKPSTDADGDENVDIAEAKQDPAKANASVSVSATDGGEDSDYKDSGEVSAPQKDYMAAIKQQWAAEKAHKEQWAAEQRQKKAEEERRKKELMMDSANEQESDT